MREAFVLGAGFSAAISHHLPLTDALGNEAVSRDPQHLGRSPQKQHFTGGTFETWLSRRAEAQPYLSTAENIESQAVFARGTKLIATILDERVDQALSSPMPSWLGELITHWHLHYSEVLTFNYDTLVECAFQTMQFWDWRLEGSFTWGSLLDYTPEGVGGLSYGERDGTSAPHPSFRLRKLHGSLNWYWVPGDAAGATTRRVRLPGDFGTPNRLQDREAHWTAPGRERFIVPPAALKSAYYQNPIIREIWQRSLEALTDADVVTLIGYSVPQTDHSTSGMLAEALAHGGKEVRIVNLRPGDESASDSVTGRVRNLGEFDVNVAPAITGATAVEDYVRRLVAADAQNALTSVMNVDLSPATPLFVDWGPTPDGARAAAVLAVERADRDGVVVVRTETLGDRWKAFQSRKDAAGVSRDVPATVGQLRDAAANAKRIAIETPDGTRAASVIDSAVRHTDTGHSNTWLQLVAAGLTV